MMIGCSKFMILFRAELAFGVKSSIECPFELDRRVWSVVRFKFVMIEWMQGQFAVSQLQLKPNISIDTFIQSEFITKCETAEWH